MVASTYHLAPENAPRPPCVPDVAFVLIPVLHGSACFAKLAAFEPGTQSIDTAIAWRAVSNRADETAAAAGLAHKVGFASRPESAT